MKLYRYTFLLIFLLPLNIYCKKKEKTSAPLNLSITANVSANGSGLVNFVASATNADRFYFNFGQDQNAEAFRSTDGKASFTYPASGTYQVKVTAYSASNEAAVATTSVTINVAFVDVGYQTPTNYPGMNLAWSDEFDGTQLKTANWSFDLGNGDNGWGNEEKQYYTQDNVGVGDGYLTITAKKETQAGFQYTSTRINTKGKKSFKYGRFDIRAKLPKGKGIWPAIWMLGANIDAVNWPLCGELDIMELVGGGPGKDNTVHGTLHYDLNGGYNQLSKSYTLPTGDFYDKFHVFSTVWDENTIKWLVDDVEFHSQDITSPSMTEFHAPFFFLLNVAVGGRWPGSPDGTTVFPQKMMVDYVRVFQK